MRWERLFADLEGQLEAAAAADLTAEVADRTRREVALLHALDRLAPAIGERVTVDVLAVGPISGELSAVGTDWLLLTEAAGRQALVPLAAVVSVRGLDARSAAPGRSTMLAGGLPLGYALRGIARDRTPVLVTARDGSTLRGTLDRVGADFVDLAEHPAGEHRRPGAVRALRLVATAAIAAVRSS